jgi:hypothetical protein
MIGFRLGADIVMVWFRFTSIVAIALIFCSCAGNKGPTSGMIRKQIEDLGLGTMEKDRLHIQQVLVVQKNQAIVETNLQLSMQVSRGKGNDWQIKSVRLGDRDWVDISLFMETFNSIRTRQTLEMLDILANAVVLYRTKAGGNPPLTNIVKLTDVLVPGFLPEVIRFDSWNREIRLEPQADGSLVFRSLGADGVLNTPDDIIKHF